MNLPRINLHGVLLLDKPRGLSSTQALAQAKYCLGARKAGHTGTLDPLATGLLPLCFGEATKFSADLLEANKSYEAIAKLGVKTTTGDSEGTVLQVRQVQLAREHIDAAVARFSGDIDQVPPMYSALKLDGKPLYEYARAGINVERATRNVTIEAFQTLDFSGDAWRFRVTCSKGTYVRTLAEDVGEALGCGAHLTALRRTQVGELDVTQAITLEALSLLTLEERRMKLLPVDTLLRSLARVDLAEPEAQRFRQGQRLKLPPGTSGRVRVYHHSDEHPAHVLLGTAQLDATGRLQPERLITTTTTKD